MKNFFRIVKETFYSKTLYTKVSRESAWNGVGFLVKLSVVIGVVLGLIAMIVGFLFLPRLKHAVATYIATGYPDALVVTIKDGTLTTNSTTPVIIPVPDLGKKKDTDQPANLLVIAPDESADISVLNKYNTTAVATGKALLIQTTSDFRVYPYGKLNTIITKESLGTSIASAEKMGAKIFLIAIIPVIILTLLVIICSKLIGLFVIAFILWIIFKIMKTPHSYKQLYRQVVYALAPALVIDCIALPLGFSGTMLTSAIVIIILFVVNRDYQKNPETSTIE